MMTLEEARARAESETKKSRHNKGVECDRLAGAERASAQYCTRRNGIEKELADVGAVLQRLGREVALDPDDKKAVEGLEAATSLKSTLTARLQVIDGELVPEVSREIAECRQRYAAADAALNRAEKNQAIAERVIPADMRVEALLAELAAALTASRAAHAAIGEFEADRLLCRIAPREVVQMMARWNDRVVPLDTESLCAWHLERLEGAWLTDELRSPTSQLVEDIR